jgi:sugar O-acyltransferase (sialic acid O-acetyltransferase NeuD family)
VELIVLGAGGTGLDVLDLVDALAAAGAAHRCLGFLDDARHAGTLVGGVPILGALADAHRWPNAALVDALGSPANYRTRAPTVARASADPDRFASLVHPRAGVSPRASVGRGTLVFAGAVVGAEARLGEHVIVLANAVVNHATTVGDYSILATGATVSGMVRVGRACYLGAGSHVIQRAVVGDEALVGMGAVVVRDVAAGSVVAGNPARPLRQHGG